jgi:hypothetical protein
LSEFVDDTNAKEVNKSLFKVDVKVYYCKVCCSVISEVKDIYSHIETEFHKAKRNEEVSLLNCLIYSLYKGIYVIINYKKEDECFDRFN